MRVVYTSNTIGCLSIEIVADELSELDGEQSRARTLNQAKQVAANLIGYNMCYILDDNDNTIYRFTFENQTQYSVKENNGFWVPK